MNEWKNINEQLPPDNENKYRGDLYLVTIECDTWEERKTMVMEWETTMVRKTFKRRWKWNHSIKMDAWVVTHWMPFPKPSVD